MKMFNFLDFAREPKKILYGGLLIMVMMIAVGFLLGYYMGVNVCQNYYLDKLLKLKDTCIPLGFG